MPAQARLRGTLPAPPAAREGFKRAHELWRTAARVLKEASEASKVANTRSKQALARQVTEGDDYEAASAEAEPVIRGRLFGSADVLERYGEEARAAKATKREARRAEGEAWERRRARLDDLRAAERGER